MDGEKFDSLAKRFCTTRLTRKNALRGLVAGVAAAVTGASFASGDVDARKRRQGRVSASTETTDTQCACADNLSPKQCPAQSGIEYTCKLCPGIKKGSVQVKCDDTTKTCVCQSTECVVGDKKYKKGETVGACQPQLCPDADCPEKPCKTVVCSPKTGLCEYTPVKCEEKKCQTVVCNPETDKCEYTDVVCPPKPCKTVVCNPETGDCDYTPVVCPPRNGCTVVCNPETNKCKYTCQCLEGESPKRCEKDGPQYTCKRCPGGNNGGSVQVVCDASGTPHCVCNSEHCTIGTTTVDDNTDVTAICPPVQCNTGLPV